MKKYLTPELKLAEIEYVDVIMASSFTPGDNDGDDGLFQPL